MQTCKYCGSETFIETRCAEDSPHYARLDCKGCGRFAKWAPWPDNRNISPDLWAMALRSSPCALRGSDGQVSMAKVVRSQLLARARRENRPELASLINSIQDASWFIANAGRSRDGFDAVRWPRVSQMVGGKERKGSA